MSVACTNCGAAVQLPSSLNHTQLHTVPNDPLIPFVKAQIDDLTAQNSNLVAENDSLSSKLVESTEGRIDLDQQLTMTQMELQTAQTELKTLQESQKHYEELLSMISTGQLIEKKDVQPVIENLAYESQRRSQIESSKLQLESELEDLSRSLFEEANRMVNEERQATFLAGKKAEGLERQLDEVLDLCKSERDQLVELKLSMQKLSEEKDQVQRERDAIEFAFVQLQQQQHHQQQLQLHHSQLLGASTSSSPTSIHHHMSATTAARRGIPLLPPTSPSSATGNINGMTPLGINVDAATSGVRKHVQQVLQYDARQHRSSASSIKSKTDSCYFSDGDHPGSHLLNEPNEERIPSLGFHLWDPSFVEFKAYMESLFGSGNSKQDAADTQKGGSNPGNGQHSASPSVASSGITSMYSFSLMTKTATAPAPAANAVIPINTLLSNCRLLKKMSSEDVEATLRFDPGNLLSWTQRKRLMTAVTDNTLVVESIPTSSHRDSQQQQSLSPTSVTPTTTGPVTRPNCALCGHGITTPLYYQYRLTDTANESRTICPYCRTRLTSVCTFYSVLRMISKRIISSTTTPEKLYLDFLRIRLGMFMARCGVGIVTGDEAKPQSPLPPPQPQPQQAPVVAPKRDSGATAKSALPPRPPLTPVTTTINNNGHNNSSSSLNSSATAPDPPMPTNTKLLPSLPSPVPPSPTPSSALPPLPSVLASTVINSNVVPNQATLTSPL
ncbi:Rab guanine nucleotide exchange factor SEC2 [Entomortierella parvispora]|uniref:Rab guanine nucleotide exchange factor SEC2 n=1 Tax=Entomortierella parvispora TaxID=205924 RepID=A0A9P3HJC1_9FUNG|nr:Rab guanine nucleotide exchange factor SEC2 [Entomortierella parvispora]